MVSVWNHDTSAQDLILTLHFNGGSYDYPIHLNAQSSATASLFDILHSDAPDANGNTIPAGVEAGSATLSGAEGEVEPINVTLTAANYDVGHATCVFTCKTCNGYTSFYIDPAPWDSPYPDNLQLSGIGHFSTGTQYDLTAGSTWSSGNTSVANIGNGSSAGLISPVAPGSATIYATTAEVQLYGRACGDPPDCSDLLGILPDQADGNIGPRIQQIYPTPIVVGTNGAMAIAGSGFSKFQGSISVSLDGSGVTVSQGMIASDTLINANYTAASNAQTGTQHLAISFLGSDGGGTAKSNAFPVVVSSTWPIPMSAAIDQNDLKTYSNQTWTSCDGQNSMNNAYGCQRCLIYQIEDYAGNPIPENFAVQEVVSQVDGNVSAPLQTGNNVSNAGGQFSDALIFIKSSPWPSNACWIGKQTITATGNSSPIRVNCIQFGASDVSITDVTSNPNSCSIATHHC